MYIYITFDKKAHRERYSVEKICGPKQYPGSLGYLTGRTFASFFPLFSEKC